MATLPSDVLDLGDWKLQLPVDAEGGFDGRYSEVRDLEGYASRWFAVGPDGAVVLTAPVEGVTTGGARYARTELRELTDGANAAWSLEEGGRMAATLRVDAVPTEFDGTEAKVVLGQIHGGDHQLVRLYYEDGTVYWVNGRNEEQARDTVHAFRDAQGRTPDIALGETFRYAFEVEGDRLSLSLQADGITYASRIAVGEGWDDNLFYFKAGLYLGTNETTSRGQGQVSLFDLDLGHDASPTPDAPLPDPDGGGGEPAPGPSPEPAPAPTGSPVLVGTNHADALLGTGAAETIDGRRSNDRIAGLGGDDILIGGSGSDRFQFSSAGDGVATIRDWESKDQIALDRRAFGVLGQDVEEGQLRLGRAARDGDDLLIYDPSTGALFFDPDGSGSAAAVQVAHLVDAPALTFADFELF